MITKKNIHRARIYFMQTPGVPGNMKPTAVLDGVLYSTAADPSKMERIGSTPEELKDAFSKMHVVSRSVTRDLAESKLRKERDDKIEQIRKSYEEEIEKDLRDFSSRLPEVQKEEAAKAMPDLEEVHRMQEDHGIGELEMTEEELEILRGALDKPYGVE